MLTSWQGLENLPLPESKEVHEKIIKTVERLQETAGGGFSWAYMGQLKYCLLQIITYWIK